MSFLSLEQVNHTYFTNQSAKNALDHISLQINEGEFVSLLGPSGCGKTTLLSIVAGLIRPTSGKVYIDGNPVNGPNSTTGYMLQQDYLFPWKTIEENILLGLKTMKKLTPESRTKTLELLEQIGLEGIEKLFPAQLSGGMRQRAALVRTLATNPKVLLLDEPFSALDYQTKLKLEDLVHSTLKKFNKTALLVTHDIGEAIAMSDRIYLLKPAPGTVAAEFEIPELLKSLSPFDARQHPLFSGLFQKIWKELESLESTNPVS